MTKAEIVNEVAKATGIEKATVQTVVEGFITKQTTLTIPAHDIPAFKPAKTFVNSVK